MDERRLFRSYPRFHGRPCRAGSCEWRPHRSNKRRRHHCLRYSEARAQRKAHGRRNPAPPLYLESAPAALHYRRNGEVCPARLLFLVGSHYRRAQVIFSRSSNCLEDLMKLTGAEILCESLTKLGVRHIFGYPGGAILPVYDALGKSKLHHILVRHEQGATHMADGYARASGGVGPAMATSVPVATNMVTGIATAMLDSSPVVCITG